MNPVIEIKDLSKRYGKHLALDKISLQVAPGDFYGFIGPNGAGKSTTIRILLGLINKTSGQAFINQEVAKPNAVNILRNIGYVPSESNYYSGMTAHETIKMAAKNHGQVSPSETQRLIDLFQVQENRKVQELSFGNRRKISLVTALQHQPQLIILDEPTSGLDPLIQQRFWEELQTRNQAGVTIFTSSHNLNEVQKYCRHAAIIREGRIIEEGSLHELMDTTAKRIHIHGLSDLPQLQGDIRDFVQGQDQVTFLYQGDIPHLLHQLGDQADQIQDIEITNPDLEEVFMHYYDNPKEG